MNLIGAIVAFSALIGTSTLISYSFYKREASTHNKRDENIIKSVPFSTPNSKQIIKLEIPKPELAEATIAS